MRDIIPVHRIMLVFIGQVVFILKLRKIEISELIGSHLQREYGRIGNLDMFVQQSIMNQMC